MRQILLADHGRQDGRVRICRVKPGADDIDHDNEQAGGYGEDGQQVLWKVSLVGHL